MAYKKFPNPNPERRRKSPARALKGQLRLAALVQELFPKGIQTKDPDQLLADLQLIESLKERL